MAEHNDPRVPRLFWLRYGVASAASFLCNPAMAALMVAQAAGAVIVQARLLAAPRPLAPVALRLPFAPGDSWRVARGGITRRDSHSWALPAQRYAIDFISPGPLRLGPHRQLTDYPAFGRPVLVAADGIVVAARDGRRDYPYPGRGSFDWQVRDPRGNFVRIRHADGTHALYAHLARQSVAVAPGQAVAAGTPLGRCGNSGHSTEPHLHVHVQDRAHWLLAAGLPPHFANARTDGTTPFLREDDTVEAGPDTAIAPAPLPPPQGAFADLLSALLSLAVVLLGASGLVLGVLSILRRLLAAAGLAP